ncbi:E3 SUMO-protein ligase ZBED1 isoform X2 [Tachysurus fulvidraco]|uniref:E3 SUMO-protein ligase ZBED1 isoform X2 n=1 Tax=Tachysurus fulvidraco TaxID=1234273 RepID=UPI001FEFE4E3|nr:E3 SUMO-protein ligase ZBED1 isoform X2 [Tachysurus fulvidraco]
MEMRRSHPERSRRHHPYTNNKLPFRHVYKDHTFTKAGEHFDLKKHLLEMIVTDLQTPTFIEEYGYRRFMNALNPSAYLALSASEMRKELVNMYVSTKKKVMDAVRTAKDPVLSAELWISSKEESYLTVTCHFIDNKWKLKSYTLDTAQLLGEHTPENVYRQLWRISEEWEITKKIQVVVNNVDGMKKVSQHLNWTYIPCFSHTLNKVILEVVASPDWRYLLKKCRHIVQFFHQENEALWSDHLAQSSCVDWLSTLNMVETICKQWPKFSQLSSYKQADKLWLNENERKLLENITKALTVVKDVTWEIGTRGYVQISNIIPLLVKLNLRIQRLRQQGNSVALRLIEKCHHHFGNINKNIWFIVSTALDPRFKSSVLKNEEEIVKTKIKEEMCKLASAVMSNDCQRNISGKVNYEDLFLQYAIEGDVSATPLQYWGAMSKSNDMSMVAHKYLSVISTAIPIERMIHEDKSRFLFNRRKCLEPKDINMMLFLNGNHQKI